MKKGSSESLYGTFSSEVLKAEEFVKVKGVVFFRIPRKSKLLLFAYA